jgi:hypothetical protein
MAYRIRCSTQFDITETGVRNNYKSARMPFADLSGSMIHNEHDWHKARNQQRNWETMNQIISLRTFPENISSPVKENEAWHFFFEIEHIDTVDTIDTPLGLLLQDCVGVPMMLGLDEHQELLPVLTITGPMKNIWFNIDINTI